MFIGASSAIVPHGALSLWIISAALTTTAIVGIVAWLVRVVARDALAKARPDDVPEIIKGLSSFLGQATTVVPRQRQTLPSDLGQVDDESVGDHADDSRGRG